ncbi:DUF2809 domain-containing protein [Oxynema sp. CENA135]|uniref:DUF2809 domain-containing protein n=1 Tax=Oxynema sp. CENA135 TaxID=984206 RepID=UPI001909241E|nr:DUF2809 domain-containing protein [Oxynema sp. CENA135]MBK4730749.1 DUF2809 domain-containing protein [Oxynema sp. CENA135]
MSKINKQFIWPSVISILLGKAILVYRGPGWTFFRFYIGDVVAVAFLYFFLSLFWRISCYWRAGAIGAIAVAIEFAQLFKLTPQNDSFLTEIVFGSHFEVWDFLAYFAGLAIAILIENYALVERR